jgi:hypothetical protein
MKKLVLTILLLQVLVPAMFAAPASEACTLCVGVASDLQITPLATLPMLIQVSEEQLPKAAIYTASLTKEQKKSTSVVISYSVDMSHDPLAQVEEHTTNIIHWAQLTGQLAGLGVEVQGADAATAGYAIKRLAVMAQGLGVTTEILTRRESLDALSALYTTGAEAYFDVVLTDGADVAAMAKWLTVKDPVKRIAAVVTPSSPNPMFDVAKAFADGARSAYLAVRPETAETYTVARNLLGAFAGDYAYDATSGARLLDAKGNATAGSVLAFVRGEDLRTLLVPAGSKDAATIISVSTSDFAKPRRVDLAGEKAITDVGTKGRNFLIGVQPGSAPYLVVVDHQEHPEANVTKDKLDVSQKRTISVEEIIRNHQSYHSFQESIQPRYVAKNTTKLRFSLGDGGEAVEATIAGDYFSEPNNKSDWVWQDLYLNGVKWKYGRIPELPLIQPEKVTQLPLDIHLTNDYRYQLAGETDLLGFHTYEVRFEPPPNAPADLPLYRGTVWIDSRTWARIRISMVQLNLAGGEVLSNEERVDFVPFATASNLPLTAQQVNATDGRSVLWLPREVSAQQVISAAGRANVVLRSTMFTDFQINSVDFDRRHQEASASDARMVRETQAGLRYLERRGDGTRVVKEGFDDSRTFLLGGIHHDAGLEFPVVPLGGIDYFNFNLANRGIQANVFFAGIIVAANVTNPSFMKTRMNVGVDFFGIALPTTNSMYRDGTEVETEAVKAVPLGLHFKAGHPFLQFGKFDATLGLSHLTYQRSDKTAAGFEVPADTFVINPGVELRYDRRGWSFSTSADYSRRTNWKPWGLASEYDPKQQSYSQWDASIGKSFYLPKFQRLGFEVNYLGGQNLDRFSKYELGFFGARRIHGIRSGSVRAEKAVLGHLSYGFVVGQAFRLEAFYDHGLITDHNSGLEHAPYQGLGLGGQTVGPYGTILRLDLGKTVGRNRQNGFVANVVFLKLFG